MITKVSYLRQNKGITIREMAKKIEVGYVTMCNIDKGRRPATVVQAEKIGVFFEKDPKELFDYTRVALPMTPEMAV